LYDFCARSTVPAEIITIATANSFQQSHDPLTMGQWVMGYGSNGSKNMGGLVGHG